MVQGKKQLNSKPKFAGETLDEHAEEIDLESKLLYGKIVKN